MDPTWRMLLGVLAILLVMAVLELGGARLGANPNQPPVPYPVPATAAER